MSTQFDAISAKVKAMRAKMLTDGDYGQLLGKKSVGEICGYLKGTGAYAEVLADVNESQIHRTELEILLEQKYKAEYRKLYKFVGLYDRKLLRYIIMREEIDFMKYRLKYIMSNETYENTGLEKYLTPFFREHTSLDLDAVMAAGDFTGFAGACAGTVYHEVLSRISGFDITLLDAEMVLDGFYYKEMWGGIKKYTGKRGIEPMKEYLGTNIDLLNILLIYRSKKYYNIRNEIIYTYLIPVRYKLSGDVITLMAEAESPAGVTEAVRSTKYGELFENIGENEFIEENYKRIMFKTAEKIMRQSPASMAAVYAYFHMSDVEIGNITTIIEGIRYSFNADAIKRLLIR